MSASFLVPGMTKCQAPLEELPPEVRQYILVAAEPSGLRSLTRASPVYLRQYLESRRSLIWRCLHNALDTCVLDAYEELQSSPSTSPTSESSDPIDAYMKRHEIRKERCQSPSRVAAPPQELAAKQSVRMLNFYVNTVRPLVSQFIQWNMTNLPELIIHNNDSYKISTTESSRIIRAFYRFQLCCHLFASRADNTKAVTRVSPDERCICLQSTFEPWEIEEILCVYEFIKYTSYRIFRRIDWKLEPEIEDKAESSVRRKDSSVPFEVNSLSDKEEEASIRRAQLQGICSQGLEVFQTVQRTALTSDDATLRRKLKDLVPDRPPLFLDDNTSLADDRQERLRNTLTLPTHTRQNDHEPQSFTGDDLASAPLAWTTLWGGVYSSRVGGFIPPELRRWGYIFWDAERIRRKKIGEELRAAWEERWDGAQLREELLEDD